MATQVISQQTVQPHEPVESGYKGHTVLTSLNYYADPGDGSPPVPVVVGDNTVTNERPTVAQPVAVQDITGEEEKYTLSSHGFQLVRHKTGFRDFRNLEALKSEYFPEVERLVKDVTGAVRVVVFDHKVRHAPSDWHNLGKNNASKRGPLHKVHIDQSPDGALMALEQRLPEEAEELKKRRFQIINVWRPIKTILKDPLAVADSNSVPDADLVKAYVVYPDHRKEFFTVLPNPAHRWFFKYRQTPDETMFIKIYDTEESVARRVPHSAFSDPDEEDKEDRESIEVRTLVFY
ncbi:hypothetical protein GE09DRAFT_1074339 [Coniochaeta sp. 2T2.1]|nr:hypothetical protein GE09DRAFT_1074339 [Coniochaeta sp. 2T2.1]